MRSLKYCLPAFVLMLLIFSCSSKKASPVVPAEITDIRDFLNLYPQTSLPFSFADSSLNKMKSDSVSLPYKTMTRFVPDTILRNFFGKGSKPVFYPMARIVVPKEGQYLFAKAVLGPRKAILLMAFDKKQQFIAAVTALKPDQDQFTAQSGVFDSKFTLNKSVVKKNRDGSQQDGKEVYVLNEASKSFMLIMTEALDDKATELINPIDTLPRKNKWSADYASGKRNMVSVRDGRRSDRLEFFLHVEKENGECAGQLKGEAFIKSSGTAEYTQAGDPCKLIFIFSSNAVTLKEEEGCGSHRGIQCTLDGSFARKKYIKPGKTNVRHK